MSDSTNGIPPVPASTPPAGWYDDGSGRQRYWDGRVWTEHYADQQPPASAASVAPGATAGTTAPTTSRKGLWIALAIVGGLVLLLLIAGITIAVVGLVTRAADLVPNGGIPVTSAPELEESEDPADEVEEPAEPAEPPADSDTALFGETWEYTDGLAVTVSAPQEFEPSATAFAPEGAQAYVLFDVTIVNGTEEAFEPLMITSLQSGDAEAEQVFDMENGLNGPPTANLLPGRELTFRVGFGVADPNDLVLQVSPNLQYEEAIFVSSP